MTAEARIERVIRPDPRVEAVHGVTWDGRLIWAAVGDQIVGLDPETGQAVAAVTVAAMAGTAFDGQRIFQLAGGRIRVIDPVTGEVERELPAPPGNDCSGMAWSEGSLWIGQYRGRQILQVDPADGAILRQIEVGRMVTGVTWSEHQIWHGSWDGERGAVHRIDPATGREQETRRLPKGVHVSGIESDGQGRLFCGAGAEAVINVVDLASDRSAP